MKIANEIDLVKNFPKLYEFYGRDVGHPIAAGFGVKDGWFELVKEVSSKLEVCISQYEEFCETCEHALENHEKSADEKEFCTACKGLYDSVASDDPVSDPASKYHIHNYIPYWPRALQVKQKNGRLRVYVTFATDEMRAVLADAAERSASICEECGASGCTIEIDGWRTVRCSSCRPPTYTVPDELQRANDGRDSKG